MWAGVKKILSSAQNAIKWMRVSQKSCSEHLTRGQGGVDYYVSMVSTYHNNIMVTSLDELKAADLFVASIFSDGSSENPFCP